MSLTISDIPKSSDWRLPARLGYLVIFLTFGIGGAWVTIAQISSAVMAPATVSVQTNVKQVQHLEGGIVGEILVRENQHVTQGQLLIRLSDVQAKAALVTVRHDLVAARVQEARLLAERDQKSEIELPPDLEAAASTDPVVAHAVEDEKAAFTDREQSLQGQIGVLQSRIDQLKTQIQGLMIEQASTTAQMGLIDKELSGLNQLLAEHLVPLPRVLETERERARLQGAIGQLISDQAKAKQAIGETEISIQGLRQKLQEETATNLLEVRQKIADLSERLSVNQDIMKRIEVLAPVSGDIQALNVHSIGQVIRAGEPLMEIVPDDEPLDIRAHFVPTDIDRIQRGAEVEVRFPSFHSRSTPVILGTLASVSADRLNDDASHEPYYLGVISVNKLRIPEELRERLRAGMPAEVLVPLGKRPVLSYLVSPMMEFWNKTFREE